MGQKVTDVYRSGRVILPLDLAKALVQNLVFLKYPNRSSMTNSAATTIAECEYSVV